jgi:hypothetical protein
MTEADGAVEKYRSLNLSCTYHFLRESTAHCYFFFMKVLVSTLICYGVFKLIYSPKYKGWITGALISV